MSNLVCLHEKIKQVSSVKSQTNLIPGISLQKTSHMINILGECLVNMAYCNTFLPELPSMILAVSLKDTIKSLF